MADAPCIQAIAVPVHSGKMETEELEPQTSGLQEELEQEFFFEEKDPENVAMEMLQEGSEYSQWQGIAMDSPEEGFDTYPSTFAPR
ncbi:hypothetical protein NDU88_006932 [Pleurodeles waltl]|uniref:Uncharacterized protein n=1 Tax=Pleurodeles waltl TaxID=8319 RepID=A0AAV7TZ04_PLEWA|nr:hypothetical protein NDU88_006932 [Pleurodeles waltl]